MRDDAVEARLIALIAVVTLAARLIAEQSQALRREVDQFLMTVRAA